jgi:hypothetical protein
MNYNINIVSLEGVLNFNFNIVSLQWALKGTVRRKLRWVKSGINQ